MVLRSSRHWCKAPSGARVRQSGRSDRRLHRAGPAVLTNAQVVATPCVLRGPRCLPVDSTDRRVDLPGGAGSHLDQVVQLVMRPSVAEAHDAVLTVGHPDETAAGLDGHSTALVGIDDQDLTIPLVDHPVTRGVLRRGAVGTGEGSGSAVCRSRLRRHEQAGDQRHDGYDQEPHRQGEAVGLHVRLRSHDQSPLSKG